MPLARRTGGADPRAAVRTPFALLVPGLALTVALALILALAMWLAAPTANAAEAPSFDRTAYRTAGIDLQKRTVRYGPFRVAPGGDHGGHGGHQGGGGNMVRRDIQKPCRRCHLVGATFDLTHENGRTANYHNGAMLHHMVLFNNARRDATCTTWPERFLAAGNERTPFLVPFRYGYPVRANHRWNLLTHLMNMTGHHQRLFIEVDYFYAKPAAGLRPVRPIWLDIANCTNSEYSIPAGHSKAGASFPVTRRMEGRLLSMGGHLHDGGRRITTKRKRGDSLRHICTSRAGYDEDPSYKGHIESMTGCLDDPLTRLKQGDRLNLKSVYRSAAPAHDVMGIMVGYLRPKAR